MQEKDIEGECKGTMKGKAGRSGGEKGKGRVAVVQVKAGCQKGGLITFPSDVYLY